MKLGDRPKRTVTKEAWAKFALKCARPLHVAPLSRRAKLKTENNAPPGPGPCARGTNAHSPWGSPQPQPPRGPERDPEATFFSHALSREGGGPHRARVPVSPTRVSGAPPRALTCWAGACTGCTGVPCCPPPSGTPGTKGWRARPRGSRVGGGSAQGSGSRVLPPPHSRSRRLASLELLSEQAPREGTVAEAAARGGGPRWPATPAAAGAASSSCGGRHVPPPHPAPRRPRKPRPQEGTPTIAESHLP